MKYIRLSIIILGLFTTSIIFSQISHGGSPYFLQHSILRSTSSAFFVEMPSFDLDSLLLSEEGVNKGNMRGGYKFAHKFYTNININDGLKTVLPDGTTVKQIGINSNGAYSINLLLSDFELPPGGKLFIYNADHSYIVGSFDHRNNSPEKILPIQPVAGESIIVEYSEPANTPFAGNFTIAEVNHDYRDILKAGPGVDLSSFTCIPDVLCSDAAPKTIHSTVLLVINGSTLCSGSLINNTSGDGKPYLLTAVHCFVDKPNPEILFPTDMGHYIERADKIVAFFNYDRPVCDANIKMKGSEEMTLAGAYARVIVPKRDIALLEFKDLPPAYFNAYYAGWNRDLSKSGTTHTNIHHPSGTVKKYGMTDKTIGLVSIFPQIFDSNSHWKIPSWTIGSTASGSSGSPLFDENNLVIGGLTSGESYCKGANPDGNSDWFFALGCSWETGNDNTQLKTWLDPLNIGISQCEGMDPNQTNPVVRLANAKYTEGDSLITSKFDFPNEGYVFGNSNLSTLEFAEEFYKKNTVEIFGAFLMIPKMDNTSSVTVSVYTGENSPETKIYSTSFIPRLNYPTETFVIFDKPVYVKNKFFISYSIDNSSSAKFCVYNTKFKDNSSDNTAWIKDETDWIPADEYELYMKKTSLAIHPLIRNKKDDNIEIIPAPSSYGFYYDRSGRILNLKEALDNNGQITIYSVSGQLLEKVPVQQGQTEFIIREQPKGTIGIVRLSSNYISYTGKIIY